jgi:hypothetical protein
MGHAAGELADYFHFLRFDELRLCQFRLRIGSRRPRLRPSNLRVVAGHVLVLMIAAHDSIPAHFISPSKDGLQ